MKLVIGGSTGLVGTELLRQALANPSVTSIVGISRRETKLPEGLSDNLGKLKSIVCDDFNSYSPTLKKELEDADACIWTIAITPSKMKETPWDEVVKITRDYTLTAVRTMTEVRSVGDQKGPLRFIYMSGHFAPRDRSHVVKQLSDFGLVEVALLRGALEAQILDYADQSDNRVAACIAKPGMIHGPGMEVRTVPGLPNIELQDIAAALLDQAVNGFLKDTLSNDDMVNIGARLCSPVPIVRSIYTFLVEFVENLHVLRNGNLLLSTMESPTAMLYTLDPKAGVPQARPVATFDSRVTALTGISPLPERRPGEELYAVSGGLHTSFAFERGSMAVYIVSIPQGKVIDSIPVPDTSTMNGIGSLPRHPHILLSADSIDGRILSIDTQKCETAVLLQDAMLSPGPASSSVPPIGINGLRLRDDYLYFTNSSRGTFVRTRIDEHGRRVGGFEVVARSPDAAHIYDDFAFDGAGNAYIATHSSSVFKVTPDGVQSFLVGDGDEFSRLLVEPTSAALALDGKSIYVSNGGEFRDSPRKGGRILQITV